MKISTLKMKRIIISFLFLFLFILANKVWAENSKKYLRKNNLRLKTQTDRIVKINETVERTDMNQVKEFNPKLLKDVTDSKMEMETIPKTLEKDPEEIEKDDAELARTEAQCKVNMQKIASASMKNIQNSTDKVATSLGQLVNTGNLSSIPICPFKEEPGNYMFVILLPPPDLPVTEVHNYKITIGCSKHSCSVSKSCKKIDPGACNANLQKIKNAAQKYINKNGSMFMVVQTISISDLRASGEISVAESTCPFSGKYYVSGSSQFGVSAVTCSVCSGL